ncbi:MAG: hypothetical protein RJQ04_05435 [Longimicrobiales bacterium]
MNRSRPLHLILRTALVIGAGALPACASSGSDTPVGASRDRSITASSRGADMSVRAISDEQVVDGLLLDTRENAWARLPGIFEEIGVEVTYRDPATFQMGNRGFRVRRIDGQRPAEWLDCGMGPTARPYANEYEVTMGLMVGLQAVERGTQVAVRIDASAKPRDVSAGAIRCQSKQTLERRILSLIDPG